MWWLFSAWLVASARPPTGERQVVVVMKQAACAVCAEQLVKLRQADLPAKLTGITHDSEADAARVTNATGVPTYSHAPGIRALGLWVEELGIAQPAVVVYDRCGTEIGRLVGRRPGRDVTDHVRLLLRHAADEACKPPPQS